MLSENRGWGNLGSGFSSIFSGELYLRVNLEKKKISREDGRKNGMSSLSLLVGHTIVTIFVHLRDSSRVAS